MQVNGNQSVKASIKAGRNIFAGFKTLAISTPIYNISKTHEKYLKVATMLDNASISLPNATTIGRGAEYIIYATSEGINATSFTGNILIPHLARFTWYKLTLITDTTPAGEWKIDEQTDHSKRDRISGLLYTIEDNTLLNVTLSPDQTELIVPPMVLLFNYGPAAGNPGQDIQHIEFRGGTYPVPAPASGETEQVYICVTDLGELSWELSPVTLETRNRVLLARGIRALDGGVWKLYNFKYMPDQADADYAIRLNPLRATRFNCTPNLANATEARLNFSDFSLIEEGIGYETSRLNTDILNIPAATPGNFYTLNPGQLTAGFAAGTGTEVNGDKYWDGTAVSNVPATSYTVQVLFSSPNGNSWRLYGQQLFSGQSEAVNGALGSQWDLTGLPTDAAALTAYIIKGDQYNGSPTLDLANSNNFIITNVPQALQSIAFSGGGSSPGVAGVTIKQEGSIIGQESSVRVFDFTDKFGVVALGDTVYLDVNSGLATDVQVDTYVVNSATQPQLTTITLSKDCRQKDYLKINIDNNTILNSAYTLGNDKRTVTFNQPITVNIPQSNIEATYFIDVNIETPVLNLNTEGTVSGNFSLNTNTVYNMTAGGAISFTVPDPGSLDTNNLNQIQVQLHIPIGYSSLITFGTSSYFNNIPIVIQGSSHHENHYNLIWEYDSVIGWVVGDLQKGGINVYSSFPLFTTIYTDYELSGLDAKGWGLGGLQFTPTDPDPDFTGAYNHIKTDFITGISTTIDVVVSNVNNTDVVVSVPCVVATDGHLIIDATNPVATAALDSLYNTTGIADFYQYNSVDGWVRLPRTTGYFRAVNSKALLNKYGKDQVVKLTGDTNQANSVGSYNATQAGLGSIKVIPVDTADSGVNSGAGQTGNRIQFDSSLQVNTGNQVDVRHTGKLLYFKLGSITSPQLIGNWNDVIENVVDSYVEEILKVSILGKNTGEVFYSQSNDPLDNQGSYKGWTGEFVANASTLIGDFYNWVKAKVNTPEHKWTGTKAEYDAAFVQFGEVGFYVVDELYGSLRFPIYKAQREFVAGDANFQLYSDGYLVQQGAGGPANYNTHTMPYAYKDANSYFVVATGVPANSGGSLPKVSVTKATATSFTYGTGQGGEGTVGQYFYWRAEGQADITTVANGMLKDWQSNTKNLYPWIFTFNAEVRVTQKTEFIPPPNYIAPVPLFEKILTEGNDLISGADKVGRLRMGSQMERAIYGDYTDLDGIVHKGPITLLEEDYADGTDSSEVIEGTTIPFRQGLSKRYYSQADYNLRYNLCGNTDEAPAYCRVSADTFILPKVDFSRTRKFFKTATNSYTSPTNATVITNTWTLYTDGWCEQNISMSAVGDQEIVVPLIFNMKDLNYTAIRSGSNQSNTTLTSRWTYAVKQASAVLVWNGPSFNSTGNQNQLIVRGFVSPAVLTNIPMPTYYYQVGNSIQGAEIITASEALNSIADLQQFKLDKPGNWSNDDVVSLRHKLTDLDWNSRITMNPVSITSSTYIALADGVAYCYSYGADVIKINGVQVGVNTADSNANGIRPYPLLKGDTISYRGDIIGSCTFVPYKVAIGSNNLILGLNYFGKFATLADLNIASTDIISTSLGKGRWALVGNDTDGFIEYYTSPTDNTFTTYFWAEGIKKNNTGESDIPDYANAITIFNDITLQDNLVHTYTVTENGYVVGNVMGYYGLKAFFTINGQELGNTSSSLNSFYTSLHTGLCKVAMGDIVQIKNAQVQTATYIDRYLKFIPYR